MGITEGRADESEIKEKLSERKAEATSSETLSDLESDHKVEDGTEGSDRDIPAPDAQPESGRILKDEGGRRKDESFEL